MKAISKKNLTIMVIDDSAELLEVFKIVFEKQGYKVIIKNSSNDIVSFVMSHKIDMLLLDVILKGIDGRDICRQLKSNPITASFPVLLMSASPENLKEWSKCGAAACIEKPFDLSYIIDKINSLLGISE